MLKVLMVSSEAAPFAKTGGLADMVSSLSQALGKHNTDVRIIMPRYYSIDRGELEKEPAPVEVMMPSGREWAALFRGVLPGSSVPVYFVDHEELFGRDGVYGYSADSGFPDNARRFSFFCKSVFSVCRNLNWIPDVFHCHDWGAALVPYFLDREEKYWDFSKSISVLTIHNIGYQGISSLNDARFVQKGSGWQEISALEYNGALNLLKAGIMSADEITTVSPGYAKEIQTPEYGFKLDTILRMRSGSLYGILNGADYSVWSPETDHYISPDNYSYTNMENRKKVKKRLQKEFGLAVDNKKPVIGMVTRLVSQKGVDELLAPGTGSLAGMCSSLDLQFVILGSGDRWCEEELGKLAARFDNLKVWIGYNEKLAHLIEAGSDFFLMPSRYEPCGLNQLYSLKYGTLPIVRNTGGLADTVENYDEETGEGTGFVFNDLTPDVLYSVVEWAVSVWRSKKSDITKMRKRAMKKDFSWDNSALMYYDLYMRLLASIKDFKNKNV